MKNIKTIFLPFAFLTTILFSLLYLGSCEEGPTEPEIEPGRRDYVWEIDTLKMPFFSSLHRIWGSSPNDVWAIGPGGDLDKTIYHYDGKKWTNDGISRGISPISIWGFGSDDIWLGGLEGRIWHYNGAEWKESFNLWTDRSEPLFSGFMDIYGDEPNEVFAVGFYDSTNGRNGMIFNYNGIKWDRVNIVPTHTTLARIKRGLKTSTNYFIRGIVENDWAEDTTKILLFNGKKLTELYSAIDTKDKTNFIQNVNDEMIFVIGYSLNKFNRNQFVKFYDINDSNFGIQIFGRSLKDIFLGMESGIAHYNGNNIQYLIEIDENKVSEITAFEKNVFFLAYDFNSGLNLVYKGTLKE